MHAQATHATFSRHTNLRPLLFNWLGRVNPTTNHTYSEQCRSWCARLMPRIVHPSLLVIPRKVYSLTSLLNGTSLPDASFSTRGLNSRYPVIGSGLPNTWIAQPTLDKPTREPLIHGQR